MVKRAAVLWLALAAGGVLPCGCTKEEEAPSSGTEVTGEEVEFLRTFPASPSGGLRTETREVVKDAEAWSRTWRKANEHLAPVPDAPKVDFGKGMVAVLGIGERKTGGWSTEIVGARRVDGKLRLLYAVRAPAEGAAAAQAITRPWHAVVLPRSDDPVEWVEYRAPGK